MSDYERTTTTESQTTDPVVTRPGVPADARARRTTERYVEPAGPGPVSLAARVVTFAFGVLQALLVLRIILLLLVANPGNEVVAFVLGATDGFVEPFRGMFELNRVTADESVLDVAAIVALIGWTLVEALILAAIRIFSRRPAEV
jgi:hypothetical protein